MLSQAAPRRGRNCPLIRPLADDRVRAVIGRARPLLRVEGVMSTKLLIVSAIEPPLSPRGPAGGVSPFETMHDHLEACSGCPGA